MPNLQVVDGESVQVCARITGFPIPTVTWLKDGVPLDASLIKEDTKSGVYTLDMPTFSGAKHAGRITCVASNQAGEAKESFTIEAKGAKPHFLKELEESIVMSVGKNSGSHKLVLGQNAVFDVTIEGIPQPVVTWLKNDKELSPSHRITMVANPDDQNYQMEIKEITKDDVAKYTCRAVNVHGQAQSICLLKFLNEPHPPIVKKELEDVQVEEGEPLKLTSVVDGEPMPAVKWFKDGESLDGQNDHIKMSSRSDGSTALLIESSLMSDAGVYEVKAENMKGNTSSTAQVSVIKPVRPPQFIKPLQEKIKVEFNCPLVLEAVLSGLPRPQIEWCKDGKALDLNKTPQMVASSTDDGGVKLEIERAQPKDAGVYSIKATNPSGQAQSQTQVEVGSQPFAPLIVDNLPSKLEVATGDPLVLQTKVNAYPQAEVVWSKNNVPLQPSEHVHIITKPDGSSQLKIDSTLPQDGGKYEIAVSNPLGSASTTSQVIVDTPSLVQELPEKLKVDQGEPLVLSAQSSVPCKSVHWLKDGDELMPVDRAGELKQGEPRVHQEQDGNKYTLKIESPIVEDEGVYQLILQSPTADLVTSARVIIATPPPIIFFEDKADDELNLIKEQPQEKNPFIFIDKRSELVKELETSSSKIDDKIEPESLDSLAKQQESSALGAKAVDLSGNSPYQEDDVLSKSSLPSLSHSGSSPFIKVPNSREAASTPSNLDFDQPQSSTLIESKPTNNDSESIKSISRPLDDDDSVTHYKLEPVETKHDDSPLSPIKPDKLVDEVTSSKSQQTPSLPLSPPTVSQPLSLLTPLPPKLEIVAPSNANIATSAPDSNVKPENLKLTIQIPPNQSTSLSPDNVQLFKDEHPLPVDSFRVVIVPATGEISASLTNPLIISPPPAKPTHPLQPSKAATATEADANSGLYRIRVNDPQTGEFIDSSCQVTVVREGMLAIVCLFVCCLARSLFWSLLFLFHDSVSFSILFVVCQGFVFLIFFLFFYCLCLVNLDKAREVCVELFTN